MNDEITAIGSVRPVMIVLRQECRNKKTIITVSSAPSISVCMRPLSEPLTQSELACTSFNSTSGGSVLRISSIAAFTASPVATMLASCCLKMLKLMPGAPLKRAIESASFSRSTSAPRSPSVSTRLLRRATTMFSNCFGSRTLPSTRSSVSCTRSLITPTGWSRLASRSAVAISAGVTP